MQITHAPSGAISCTLYLKQDQSTILLGVVEHADHTDDKICDINQDYL